MKSATDLAALLAEVRACRQCAPGLPLGPRPIVQIGAGARILIAGQAPGRVAHRSGTPFADRSGATLRLWLGMDAATFYDPERVAILPQGLCYPGRGPGGDLPPRPECAPLWQRRLRAQLPALRLILPIGRHAQIHHLRARCAPTLTETVRRFRDYLPGHFPLPHPSGRNGAWFQRHPWFEQAVVPALRSEVRRALAEA